MNIICHDRGRKFMEYIFHNLFNIEEMHAEFWLGNLLKNGFLEDCEGDGRIKLRLILGMCM
jgi:hypothetical protein